ncbi:hypothetical protein [Halobellus ordinarius]|uniref:hypothetical protein n=1 Tax=Halobellus ordinarius TaxID=3075120 RepID=UPI002880ADD2|nr:hypothetical protein [Halobellus sp. ZY16]
MGMEDEVAFVFGDLGDIQVSARVENAECEDLETGDPVEHEIVEVDEPIDHERVFYRVEPKA